jgi:hypothetical protein
MENNQYLKGESILKINLSLETFPKNLKYLFIKTKPLKIFERIAIENLYP